MDKVSAGLGDQLLLRQSLSAVGAVAWQWDLDSGVFNYSQAHAQEMGLVVDDDVFSLTDSMSPTDFDALLSSAEKACSGSEAFEQLIHIKIGSDYHPFRVIGSRLDAQHSVNLQGGPTRKLAGVMLAGVDTGFLLNKILNNTSILVYVKDLMGHYLFVNHQYALTCGLSLEQILGKTDRELFDIGSAVNIQRLENWIVESGKPMQLEESLPFGEAGVTYLSGRFPIRNSQGDVYALGGVYTDISQNKSFENTIERQRLQLRQVIDAIPSQIWHLNRWGEVIELNEEAAQTVGVSIAEAKGCTILEFLPWWDDPAERHREILHVIRTGKPILGSVESYSREGEQYWVSVDKIPMLSTDGELVELLLVASDISELKRHEQILAHNDARYRAFIANSNEAIFGIGIDPPMPVNLSVEKQLEWFARHGRYIECNQVFADDCNRRVDAVVGQSVQGIGFIARFFEENLGQFFRNNFSFDNQTYENKSEAQRSRWFDVSIKGDAASSHLSEVWSIYRDITDSKQYELEIERSEARYRSFIENSHEGILNLSLTEPVSLALTVDEQLTAIIDGLVLTECNGEYARQMGFESSVEMIGRRVMEWSKRETIESMVAAFIKNNYQLARHEEAVEVKGDTTWLSTSLEGIIENNQLIGCWATQRDITERRKYLEELEYQATHDSLTLLPNRKKLYIEAEKALAQRPEGRGLALMLIDLDRFKEINDTLGHHMGDKLLKQLGPRLEVQINECEGIVARLGGDEFGVMLSGISEQQALDKAQKILNAINQTFDLDGFKADISASVGISFCPKHGDDVGTLMRYADVAMYAAKTGGLGCLEYSADYDEHTPKRLSLMTDLGRAIRENQLHLHYQPKLDLDGKQLSGFEALLRWQHPEHGFIPPGEFIPIAETTELIHPLTLWVLDTAAQQCRRWRDCGYDVVVSVNLSTRNLLDENIVEHVQATLSRHGIPSAALELEITESSIMANPNRALAILQQLFSLGVHMSIDDFGTGYSSLAYLKRLPVESLKIDYSFVVDMLEDEQDEIIVNSTINLAHNLGLKVVAEGVESEAILTRLRSLGCDQAQGYHIGKPMAEEMVESWMKLADCKVRHLGPDSISVKNG